MDSATVQASKYEDIDLNPCTRSIFAKEMSGVVDVGMSKGLIEVDSVSWQLRGSSRKGSSNESLADYTILNAVLDCLPPMDDPKSRNPHVIEGRIHSQMMRPGVRIQDHEPCEVVLPQHNRVNVVIGKQFTLGYTTFEV